MRNAYNNCKKFCMYKKDCMLVNILTFFSLQIFLPLAVAIYKQVLWKGTQSSVIGTPTMTDCMLYGERE